MKNPSSAIDEQFVQEAVKIVLKNLGEFHFSVTQLSEKLHYSREHTHRKLKNYLGVSAGKFIRYIRLLQAYHYLVERKGMISEIAYQVGFNSPAYFSKCFKDSFGLAPGKIQSHLSISHFSQTNIYDFYKKDCIQVPLKNNKISFS
ncbi:AraC family transcriptional regulator [Echinicola marina]|uniref:helix-turn-helix domain-containing protein n=1 Tax=Echinicola marina TaxID=2859768 RepID=UPI001CF68AE0|nr:AraC family transcriptional regulator [Echinicola marina]UCS94622.1 AraC family transcriptional regulator [Echinicola marina]